MKGGVVELKTPKHSTENEKKHYYSFMTVGVPQIIIENDFELNLGSLAFSYGN